MKNRKIKYFKIIIGNLSKIIFFKLLLYIFSLSILETLGVAIIVPFYKYIFSSSLTDLHYFENYSLNLNSFRIIIILVFVFFFILKNIFSYFILNKQLHYIFSLQQNLSNKLYINYIKRDFSIHVKSDSAILMRNILNETNTLSNTLIQILYFISEFLTLFFVLVLLLIYQPTYTFIIILILSTSVVIFYKYFSKKTKLIGEERQKQDGKKIKNIQLGLNNLKEIKIFSSENFFIEKFCNSNLRSLSNAKIQNLYQQMPKLYLEVIIIFTFSLLSILFIIQNKSISEVVLILSFYGAAIFRILPSLNRLMVAVQSIQLGYPSFELLSYELENCKETNFYEKEKNDNHDKNLEFLNEIEIENLDFSYNHDENYILKNLQFKIKKGSFTAIIGESGKGKSTFINILVGLFKSQKINTKIDGVEFDMYNNIQWKRKIGYVPQKINIIDGTIAENIAFGIRKELIDYDNIQRVINLSGLSNYIDELKNGIYHEIGDYGGLASGGQLQRLAIARALYYKPELLILDEATSSLDYVIESEILTNLRSLNNSLTIIMITHKKENLNFCDSVYLLENLKLIKLK